MAKVTKLSKSASQEIAEVQLEFLRQIARNRPLDLQETKKYEMLVKTLSLANEMEKENPNEVDTENTESEEELMSIATGTLGTVVVGTLPNVIKDPDAKDN